MIEVQTLMWYCATVLLHWCGSQLMHHTHQHWEARSQMYAMHYRAFMHHQLSSKHAVLHACYSLVASDI